MLRIEDYVPVECPVAGEWVATRSPATRVPSHGTTYLGQTYAFDFVRLNEGGTHFSSMSLRRHFLFFIPADAFFAWNQPVHAATSGRVVAASDGWPDRMRVNWLWEYVRATFLARRPSAGNYAPLLGNYVMVAGDAGVALYAHLRSGSVTVTVGDSVRAGQMVGTVGNSGNSTMPHLHFQVMDTADLEAAVGIPVGFRNYSLVEQGGLRAIGFGVPGVLQRFVGAPSKAPHASS
ncbi:MAG: M23 family metallopeptidase [Burkholderiales bacterium]|nr:M23 family metallopeptidase [Burkholderiales bacterium]